jgi:hypothetical protein
MLCTKLAFSLTQFFAFTIPNMIFAVIPLCGELQLLIQNCSSSSGKLIISCGS